MLTVEMKPVPLGRPRFSKGRVYTDAKSARAKGMLKTAMALAMRGRKRFEGPLSLHARFYFVKSKNPAEHLREHPAKRGDLDNFLKLAMDSGNEILWNDDAQICEVVAKKAYATFEHITIEVEEMN